MEDSAPSNASRLRFQLILCTWDLEIIRSAKRDALKFPIGLLDLDKAFSAREVSSGGTVVVIATATPAIL